MTRRVGTSRWRTAARATTDGNGRAAFTIRPTSTVDLRVGHPGSVVARSAISDVRRLIVRTAVRATLSEQRIDPGDAARLSGVVKPDRAGRRVILQGFRRTGWEKLKSEVVSSTGRFRFRIRPDRGWYSYRAFVRADGDRGWGASPLRTLRVERAVPVTRELSRLPNVVVILSDDQRPETLQHMKYVQSLLVRKGVSFTKAMVPTALCCPSRATILSGRYAHNTGVYSNGGIDGRKVGGWYGFHRSGAEARTLPVALSARGYRTGLIGKYLNYFGAYAPGGYSPPGWHTFLATTRNHGSYYHYELTNGEEFGSAAEDYSTDVYAARAARFIRTTRSGRPLFLYFTPYGPHAPYLPAPRHTGAWEGQLSLYDAPSVHDDLSGKPAYLQGLPEVPAEEVLRRQTRQQESLMAVDEAVSKLVTALRDTNRLRNTLVVFLSDNGYLWGDHRLVGKDKPYDPALRIPMVLRWGARVPAGGVDTRLALNVDLATTIARATQTRYASDGVNLLGAHRRHGFLLEAAAGYGGRPAYCGWRTRRWMFAQYATGERELYDLAADPHELHNLADDPAYADRLAALRSLAVQRCRPTPPGFSW